MDSGTEHPMPAVARTIRPVLGLLLLSSLTGCKPAPLPAPAPPATMRVVSLAPSITEMVCAVGAADQLVGRTTVCDYPPEAVARVPVIGEFGAPSLERLLAARPGIVLYADIADPALASRLTRIGLHHARIPCTRLDEIPAALISVGRFVHREEQAQALAAELNRRIRAARENATPSGQRPRVLMLIWNDPLTAVGRNSFLADLLALAGGQNVGESVDRDYFQVSSEWVLTQNPDIILCFFMTPGTSPRHTVSGQSGWTHVKAVQTGRIYDGFDNNLFLRPGPRVMEGMESLRQCIAPPASIGTERVNVPAGIVTDSAPSSAKTSPAGLVR